MKGIQLTKPNCLERVILPGLDASKLKPDEVRVKTKHIGLCGTDIHAINGKQAFFEYPRILGHELGVEIMEVGNAVTAVESGICCAVEPYLCEPIGRAFQRGLTNCTSSTQCLGVHVDGGMREEFVLPAIKCHLSTISTRRLALVEPLCIGYHAVERALLKGDESVAVIGLGPIGLGVAQFASRKGVKVVGIDLSADRLAFAKNWIPELEPLLLHPDESLMDLWLSQSEECPEVVWDCTGNRASMEAALELPTHGGRIVLVGIYNGQIEFSDPNFHKRELSIFASRNAVSSDFKAVISHLESGNVSVDSLITHECKLNEFPDVVDSWLQPNSGLIKGIIHLES